MGVSENDAEFLKNFDKKRKESKQTNDKTANIVLDKEKAIYDKLHSVKEIEGTEDALLTDGTVSIAQENAFNKLKELTKPIIEQDAKPSILPEKKVESKIAFDKADEKLFLGRTNETKKFSWENRSKIEEPTPADFEEYVAIGKNDLDKSLARQRQAMEFEHNKLNNPKPAFVEHPKWKHDEDNRLNWLKDEVKGEEKIKSSEFGKTPKSIDKFDWEQTSEIEEPIAKDFEEKFVDHTKLKQEKETDEKKEKIVKAITSDKVIENKSSKDLAETIEEEGEPETVNIKTPIDAMFEQLEQFHKIDSGKIAKIANIPYNVAEDIAKVFEDYGIIKIYYPTSLSKKPQLELTTKVISKITKKPSGEILDSYTLDIDHVYTKISVVQVQEEVRPVYTIDTPAIGKYTKKFLDFIKDEIAETMPIELEEITDPKKSHLLKTRFFEESQKHLKKYFPTSTKEDLDTLSGVVLHEMYGLGTIEVILGDDMLEEVAINSSRTPITVYHRIHGWLKTNLYPGTEDEIMNYSSQIGRKIGREITVLSPILDAHLLSGDRVNATLFPITAEGNTLTIRRFARRPWTIVDFVGKAHTMSSEMAALLWLAIQYEMNIVVSGGTASGKTSTLNTLLALVPSYHRSISIEDVREIVLPTYLNWNWIPMITRSANPEGLGEVTMLDCLITSLRMRPDRIIVGEMRRKKEAEVLMEAIETGHSIYSTIHANSAYQVLRRLAEPPMSIPLMQIELVDLIVVQFRDRKTNKRRTFEIAEIEQTSTGKGLQVNTIFKWMPRSDTWEQLNRPTKLLTLLNLHTGLTEEEIEIELKERKEILEWLRDKNIADLDEIGYIMKLFYSDKRKVTELVNKKVSLEQIKELMK
ncbi:MAG: CpaF family protein [Candidatus Diapherotrites archaeon]|nr:CpaF family protein [Candidatus Diapherotrites archaeon]